MYTLDASVHVSALNSTEEDSAHSQAFLAKVRQSQLPLFCPTLLVVEVAAAVARAFGDVERAVALAKVLWGWSNQTLVPLDKAMTDDAVSLAAMARLRAADAVYAAVAHHYDTTLVTLDRQQLERLKTHIKTAHPIDILRIQR
jgi:predicted nucleic acid-binding protein